MNAPSLPRLFVLGSSLTIHFDPYLRKKLEGVFHYDRKRDASGECAEANLDVPEGASAGDSSMVLAYLRKRRARNPISADILLLSCGLHDIKTDPVSGKRQVELKRFRDNLDLILDESEAMRLSTVWLRITPVVDYLHNNRCHAFRRFNADVNAYNVVADKIMEDRGVHVIDLYGLCLSLLPRSLIDHIHYDENARRLQAAFIASELKRWWSICLTAN